MNESLQTLLSRRRIRKYQKEQITDQELNQILEAGMYAPSAKGLQGASMVVIQDEAVIAAISAMNAKILGTDSDPLYGAPTVVIVFADPERSANAWSDGCLVMGNLMNAAAALGLGSCWINRAKEEFASPEGKALLKKWGLPEHLVGVGHCILGYPAETAPPPKPRKDDYVIFIK